MTAYPDRVLKAEENTRSDSQSHVLSDLHLRRRWISYQQLGCTAPPHVDGEGSLGWASSAHHGLDKAGHGAQHSAVLSRGSRCTASLSGRCESNVVKSGNITKGKATHKLDDLEICIGEPNIHTSRSCSHTNIDIPDPLASGTERSSDESHPGSCTAIAGGHSS